VVSSGTLWAGCPANYLRDLTPEEVAAVGAGACEVAGLASAHRAECAKAFEEVLKDLEDAEDAAERHPDYFPKTDPLLADVALADGGTKPLTYPENSRRPTAPAGVARNNFHQH